MGTNYYLRRKINYDVDNYETNNLVQVLVNGYVFNNKYYRTIDELNQVFFKDYHIGKSSYGWHFLLATYPDENINTLEDWKKLFDTCVIYDEYDFILNKEQMLNIIENNTSMKNKQLSKEELEKNHALKGVNGLLKRSKRYDSCIINNTTGKTYDIINHYDFS